MELAACLAGTLLVFGAGTGLLLWLISRRRQLEELDADDNKALRTVAMNRLLRTAATMASGLAANAGNFSCRPDPSSTTAWTNAAGLGAMAVLLVMWWWPPPRLPSLQPLPGNRRRGLSAAGHPPALLSASIGAAIGMAAVLPALAALFLPGPALPAYGAAAVPAVMAVSVLLAILGGELLLQRNYGRKDAVRGWPAGCPRAPHRRYRRVRAAGGSPGDHRIRRGGAEPAAQLDTDGGSNGRRRRRGRPRRRRGGDLRDPGTQACPEPRAVCPACSGGIRPMTGHWNSSAAGHDTAQTAPAKRVSRLDA